VSRAIVAMAATTTMMAPVIDHVGPSSEIRMPKTAIANPRARIRGRARSVAVRCRSRPRSYVARAEPPAPGRRQFGSVQGKAEAIGAAGPSGRTVAIASIGRVPRHAGYVEQPQNAALSDRRVRRIIGWPHRGQASSLERLLVASPVTSQNVARSTRRAAFGLQPRTYIAKASTQGGWTARTLHE
jgi:hypothetical protein